MYQIKWYKPWLNYNHRRGLTHSVKKKTKCKEEEIETRGNSLSYPIFQVSIGCTCHLDTAGASQ